MSLLDSWDSRMDQLSFLSESDVRLIVLDYLVKVGHAEAAETFFSEAILEESEAFQSTAFSPSSSDFWTSLTPPPFADNEPPSCPISGSGRDAPSSACSDLLKAPIALERPPSRASSRPRRESDFSPSLRQPPAFSPSTSSYLATATSSGELADALALLRDPLLPLARQIRQSHSLDETLDLILTHCPDVLFGTEESETGEDGIDSILFESRLEEFRRRLISEADPIETLLDYVEDELVPLLEGHPSRHRLLESTLLLLALPQTSSSNPTSTPLPSTSPLLTSRLLQRIRSVNPHTSPTPHQTLPRLDFLLRMVDWLDDLRSRSTMCRSSGNGDGNDDDDGFEGLRIRVGVGEDALEDGVVVIEDYLTGELGMRMRNRNRTVV